MTTSDNKTLLTIDEFTALTLVPEENILEMLKKGVLTCNQGKNNELLIDVGNLETSIIAEYQYKTLETTRVNNEQQLLLEEMVATTLTEVIDSLLEEALDLSMRWKQQKEEDY